MTSTLRYFAQSSSASRFTARRIRVFDFQPKRRAARAIDRAEPLRHDALATELASLAEYNRAVLGEMLNKLPVRSCLIDGEAIVCDKNGLAVFELIRRYGALASAVHCAFRRSAWCGRRQTPLPLSPLSRSKGLPLAHARHGRLIGTAV
jgi:hypothetical protein